MANLISRRAPREGKGEERPAVEGPALVGREKVAERVAELARHDPDAADGATGSTHALADALASELEELEQAPDRVVAEAVVEAIEGLHRALGRADANGVDATSRSERERRTGVARAARIALAGDLVCHRPGRSLATGEAEIASRGYFDVRDRPPIATWVGVLVHGFEGLRRDAPPESVEDLWIVAWVAPTDRERAHRGVRACPSGALEALATLAPTEAEWLKRALAAWADRAD